MRYKIIFLRYSCILHEAVSIHKYMISLIFMALSGRNDALLLCSVASRWRQSPSERSMTMNSYEVDNHAGAVPVKRWTKGVPVEDAALDQLANVAKLPFISTSGSRRCRTSTGGMGRDRGLGDPDQGRDRPPRGRRRRPRLRGLMAVETSLRAGRPSRHARARARGDREGRAAWPLRQRQAAQRSRAPGATSPSASAPAGSASSRTASR